MAVMWFPLDTRSSYCSSTIHRPSHAWSMVIRHYRLTLKLDILLCLASYALKWMAKLLTINKIVNFSKEEMRKKVMKIYLDIDQWSNMNEEKWMIRFNRNWKEEKKNLRINEISMFYFVDDDEAGLTVDSFYLWIFVYTHINTIKHRVSQ